MRPATRVGLLTALFFTVLSPAIDAQLPGHLRLPARLPSLADLTRGEPPLDTNVTNIPVRGWPEFDRVDFGAFAPLTNADRGEDGRFHLGPGRYELQLRSFCAKGYTYGPTRGDGYLRGAWQGSKAELLREILHGRSHRRAVRAGARRRADARGFRGDLVTPGAFRRGLPF